jgi:uncharacterized membrane protein YhaH (DUF805 family)
MIWLIENYFNVLFRNNTFNGRASRAEYWGFVLVNWFLEFLVWILNGGKNITYQRVNPTSNLVEFPIFTIVVIFAIIFWVAEWTVKVRRLHDSGTSGWFILIEIIPILGWIMMFFKLIKKSDEGENRFGKAVN